MRMVADLGLFRVIFVWPIQQAVEQVIGTAINGISWQI